MKIFGRLVTLLGLSLVVFASPGQENAAFPRSADLRAPAPTPSASRNPTPGRVLAPLAVLDGGDTCTAPPTISTLPFNDTGTTTGMTDNSTNELRFACGVGGGGGTVRPGPDVFYSFTIVGFGNSLTFLLTPTGQGQGWDPGIYVLGVCGDLDSCAGGADTNFEGESETFTVSGLTPGTYYFGVDSAYFPEEPFASGTYTLSVTGNFGDPNAPSPTPTQTRTPTVTERPR